VGKSDTSALRLREIPIPSRGDRKDLLVQRLASWRELAAKASEDLEMGKLPSNPLVAEFLRSIELVDYAAARRAILSGDEPRSVARDLALSCDLYLSALERRFAS
jgi:hypothetical protein